MRDEPSLQSPPFQKGDCVIDDNGEIGYVTTPFTSATWNADGTLRDWHTTIRFRWDQSSYGKERSVSDGEIEKWQPNNAESKSCDCENARIILNNALQLFWGSAHWTNELLQLPELSRETKDILVQKSLKIDRLHLRVSELEKP